MNSPQQPTAIVPEPIAAARRIEVRTTRWTVRWLLVLALMNGLDGLVAGCAASREFDREIERTTGWESVVVDDLEVSVVEYHAHIEGLRVRAFAVPLGVSAVFLGLFFWGRRSSLRALVVGLVLFVTLHVVHAVLVPENLLHGIGFEVVATAVLVAGIWRELADRRALRSPSKAVATGA